MKPLNKHQQNQKRCGIHSNNLYHQNQDLFVLLYFEVNDKIISQRDEIANVFNEFFCNIGFNLGKNFDNS